MTFEIELAGRARVVAIEPAGGTLFRVTIDGEAQLVDAVRSGAPGLSLVGADGTSREAQIVPGSAFGERLVWLDGLTALVRVDARRARRGGGQAAARASSAPAVVAPMPGRVLRVLVARGDEVTAGQAVVVVEAMKMENELRAPKAGRIADVMVDEGATVEAGRVLLVIA